ncbi:hypothetical protein ACU6U9_08825 [Pseudomonas sp. HK3]|jgi:hypothetical protein
MNIDILQIGIVIAFILSCVLIYKFLVMAISGKVPQSPAAMGIGIAALSFLPAISWFVAWFIDRNINQLFGSDLPIYLLLSIPILVSSLTLAGYLATKTSEDTSMMNLKLLIALGVIPHFIVSTFAFMSLPGWMNYLDFGAYIPAIIIGRILYIKMTNNTLKLRTQ